MRVIEVRYKRGLELPEAGLWLDSRDAKPWGFISHAHADHFARHERVLCSENTALLLRERFKLAPDRIEALAYHVPLIRNGHRLRLLPAGHIPGSAMLHATRISDNASLLYTGDFKTRRSRTAEAVSFLTADTLVMETTFGLPGYEFPNQMEVEAELLRFVHDTFADGETPILLAYSLGKAQEALAILTEHGIPALLHPAVAEMTSVCRAAGVPGLPEPIAFDGVVIPNHVIIAPPNALGTQLFKNLKPKRTAMLSGWALQPGARFRYGVNAMIPLSDHADHPALMECVKRVRPKRILTVHGYTAEFAAELRAMGMDAWSAAGGDQLELGIQRPPKRAAPQRTAWQKRVLCPLADFSDLCRLVAETGSRAAKTRFISSYLASLQNDDDLRIATSWLAGDLPTATKLRMKHSVLRHALIAIPGAREERLLEIHTAGTELPRTTRLFLQELQLQPAALDLSETETFISHYHSLTGSLEQIRLLSTRLATLHPAESETLLGLLSGDLQIGIDEGIVKKAAESSAKP